MQIICTGKTLVCISVPRQLQRLRGNADGCATWRLYREGSLQEITSFQITIENLYESTIQHLASHQWDQRLNLNLKTFHTLKGYTARFTILSHRCIQTGQISHNMDNFTFDSNKWAVWQPSKRRMYGRRNARIVQDFDTFSLWLHPDKINRYSGCHEAVP